MTSNPTPWAETPLPFTMTPDQATSYRRDPEAFIRTNNVAGYTRHAEGDPEAMCLYWQEILQAGNAKMAELATRRLDFWKSRLLAEKDGARGK